MDRQARKKEKKKGGGEEGKRKSRVRKKEISVGSVEDLFRLLSQECRYAATEKTLIGSVDVRDNYLDTEPAAS